MPRAVQVTTYLLFVVLFIYLVIKPQFIDLRLRAKAYGAVYDLEEALIDVEMGGRIISIVTDRRGYFSVPVNTIHPVMDYRFVLYPEGYKKRNLQIDITVPGYYAFFGRKRIYYIKENNSFELSECLTCSPSNSVRIDSILLSLSHASEDTVNFNEIDDIDDEILLAVSKITGMYVNDISLQYRILDDLQFTNIEISYVNYKLDEKFNVQLSSELWSNAKTIEDIVRIARADYYKDRVWGEHGNSKRKSVNELLEYSKERFGLENYKKLETARILRKAKRVQEAIQILEQLVKIEPQFYLAWYNLGLAYDAISNYKNANSAYIKAIEIEKEEQIDDAMIYITYGRFLFKREIFDDSLMIYKEAKKRDPHWFYLEEYISDSTHALTKQENENLK